ncbi:ketoacyl-ACP synthase III [Deinococcus sp.]|uniref:ketoacyl-ACP synthase III n=1 Tax=Deinococcus sp. TaxID=47478 RepID=UPI0025C35073|nr:ketoacyl-ACP synthase III [Deinococcus sp.]
MKSIGITAIGMYAPERVVRNQEFESRMGLEDGWIESRSGIRERRFSAEGEFTSTIGVKAVQDMLSRDPGALRDVDLVIYATCTPDAMFPSTAALVAGQIGLSGVGAYDLSTACSGFVYGLSMARGLILGGGARKVLVLGGETLSKALDQNDRDTAILFGDGCGCAVVGEVPVGYGFQDFVLGADSAGGPALYISNLANTFPDGQIMRDAPTMNGREVFKFAVRVLGDSGTQVLEKSGLKNSDVDWLIPHQANIRIIEAANQRFGIPMEKTVINLDRYGNTSAGTVPIALYEAVNDGRVKDGHELLMVVFGGGLSWAACTMKWWAGTPSLHAASGTDLSGTEVSA